MYVVVMSLELVDAGSCLKAKDVNVVVLASYCERVLARELAGDRDAALADEDRLSAHKLILFDVDFVHLDEAVIRCRYEL